MPTSIRRGLILVSIPLAAGCAKEPPPPPPPPPDVEVAQVLQRDVPILCEAIGETRGATEIEIRPRVTGFIESIEFAEGTVIEDGQTLYTIDDRPFQAALAEAKGSLAKAEADLARARQDVARYEPLVAKNAISREEYETAVAIERAAAAGVEAAKAVVERAEVDLGYTKVLAPEDGMIGKTEVYRGSLVSPTTLLAQISKIDPIHARVTIREADYLRYARTRADDEALNAEAAFELILADASVHPHRGRMTFVDRNVDPRTGTILVEAAFPNPELIVRPGQFARLRVVIETRPGAILVPQRAVQELQGTYSVAVVAQDGIVELRPVQPAERFGSLWRIETGLEPGERVVVEGIQKARPGIRVNPREVKIGESATGDGAADDAAAGK